MIVAMIKISEGNGEVGSMWTETGIFHQASTLKELMLWADKVKCGRKGDVVLSSPSEDHT